MACGRHGRDENRGGLGLLSSVGTGAVRARTKLTVWGLPAPRCCCEHVYRFVTVGPQAHLVINVAGVGAWTASSSGVRGWTWASGRCRPVFGCPIPVGDDGWKIRTFPTFTSGLELLAELGGPGRGHRGCDGSDRAVLETLVVSSRPGVRADAGQRPPCQDLARRRPMWRMRPAGRAARAWVVAGALCRPRGSGSCGTATATARSWCRPWTAETQRVTRCSKTPGSSWTGGLRRAGGVRPGDDRGVDRR